MGVRDKAGEMWPREARVHAGGRLRIAPNAVARVPVPAMRLPIAHAFDEFSMIT
jgi:hypothetical protein